MSGRVGRRERLPLPLQTLITVSSNVPSSRKFPLTSQEERGPFYSGLLSLSHSTQVPKLFRSKARLIHSMSRHHIQAYPACTSRSGWWARHGEGEEWDPGAPRAQDGDSRWSLSQTEHAMSSGTPQSTGKKGLFSCERASPTLLLAPLNLQLQGAPVLGQPLALSKSQSLLL